VAEPDAVDTAWKIHAAVVDWTGKVDTKAAFTLAIESALLASMVNLSADGRAFGSIHGLWSNLCYWSGIALVVSAVFISAFVVRPRLRSKHAGGEANDNYIYFGHLRHWNPDDLPETLRNEDPLPVISRQVVHMSQITWTKHLLVQRSITAAACGAACLFVAALANR
jgi:hypothetical protein